MPLNPREPPAGPHDLSPPLRDLARLLGRAIARRHLERHAAARTAAGPAGATGETTDLPPELKETACSPDSDT